MTAGDDLGRLTDLAARFGSGGHVRSRERRDADAGFELFAAARNRLPVGRVRFHVCLHDEGVGDCRAAVIEG